MVNITDPMIDPHSIPIMRLANSIAMFRTSNHSYIYVWRNSLPDYQALAYECKQQGWYEDEKDYIMFAVE